MKTIPTAAPEAYRANGYVILPELLDEDELDVLRTSCETLLAEPPSDDQHGRARSIGRGHDRRFLSNRHEQLPALGAFIKGKDMAALSATLLDSPPYLFNEQFVVKGPNTGASFAWHQDSGYVGFDHKPYLTLWMALDDTTIENGAVYVLPRNLAEDISVNPHQWDSVGKELVGYAGDEPGVPAEVPAGSVVAFSSVTLHRSSSNTTAKPRRSFIAQYSVEPILKPGTNEPKAFAIPLSL